MGARAPLGRLAQDLRRASVMSRPKAVVLLSGGLDSTTALAVARSSDYETYALSFRYGQRHVVELEAARRVAAAFDVFAHRIVDIDLRPFAGGSALTSDTPVPHAPTTGMPPTYVPGRNTIFLSYALAWAEVLKAQAIYFGVNAVDYSGYPDCRPSYVGAFQQVAHRANPEGVGPLIVAPLLHLTKAEIVQLAQRLGVDFSLTHSCYDPIDGLPCRTCDSCRIRAAGFAAAGVEDTACTR